MVYFNNFFLSNIIRKKVFATRLKCEFLRNRKKRGWEFLIKLSCLKNHFSIIRLSLFEKLPLYIHTQFLASYAIKYMTSWRFMTILHLRYKAVAKFSESEVFFIRLGQKWPKKSLLGVAKCYTVKKFDIAAVSSIYLIIFHFFNRDFHSKGWVENREILAIFSMSWFKSVVHGCIKLRRMHAITRGTWSKPTLYYNDWFRITFRAFAYASAVILRLKY